ncbi:MAG: hypothetical protein Q9N34_08465 [Aquificota bacterium]|nr:hypothetical protein [Aquificota bacterium]
MVKTVSTTYLADRICRSEGIDLREVPVGFKNINELILKEKVLFGGEESGGYGVPAYLPERDGLMSALLILEGLLLWDRPLSGVIEDIFREFGSAYYRRVDFPADEKIKEQARNIMASETLKGMRVDRVLTMDGLKLIFGDESWLLLRPSGTEPLIRVYAEAPSESELRNLIEAGVSLLRV